MTSLDWISTIELTSGTFTPDIVDKWLLTDFSTTYSVPRTVKYCHHPKVGLSNPQLPRSRYNKAFRGHLFKVGRSKK